MRNNKVKLFIIFERFYMKNCQISWLFWRFFFSGTTQNVIDKFIKMLSSNANFYSVVENYV